jgi:hypothetical protein
MPNLGHQDEPQQSGAVVAVNYGNYRTQEIWIRSGSAIGNWWCLGGEYGRPKPWDDPRTDMEKMLRHWDEPAPTPGPGEIVRYPTWEHVLARGPVTLLTPGDEATYKAGWATGRRRMVEQMEEVSDSD